MRFLLLALFFGLGAMAHGVQGTLDAMRNRSPKVVTLQEFNQIKPTGGWYTIKDCDLRLQDVMAMTKNGKVQNIYVPVYDPNAGDEGSPNRHTMLLIETDSPELKSAQADLHAMDERKASDQEYADWMLKHIDIMVQHRDVSGLIKHGLTSMDSGDRDKIFSLDKGLDQNFAVLEEGSRPSLGGSLLWLGGGVVLMLGSVAIFFGSRNSGGSKPVAMPVPTPGTGTSAPPAGPYSGPRDIKTGDAGMSSTPPATPGQGPWDEIKK